MTIISNSGKKFIFFNLKKIINVHYIHIDSCVFFFFQFSDVA
jgi:hypothetical protein